MKLRKILACLLIISTLSFSGCLDEEVADTTTTTVPTTTVANTTESTVEESTTRKIEFVENVTVTRYNNSSQGSADRTTIPPYSGKPYYKISSEPTFKDSEKVAKSFERYSSLDSLRRCGVAYACISRDTMPPANDKRGSISDVKPSGWVQHKYDFVDGGYIYNRCHLIGWQLTDEDANKENLITGTRYFNVKGMLPFENMVADYVKETGNHVLYRVTPDFRANNLVCNGVQIEAWSVEDGGDGICFNVYVYNVQPNIIINYTTGDNWVAGEKTSTTKAATKATTTKTATTTTTKASTTKTTTAAPVGSESINGTFILNTSTHKIHYPGCSSVKKMKESNKQEYNGNVGDLLNQGYTTCGNCFK